MPQPGLRSGRGLPQLRFSRSPKNRHVPRLTQKAPPINDQPRREYPSGRPSSLQQSSVQPSTSSSTSTFRSDDNSMVPSRTPESHRQRYRGPTVGRPRGWKTNQVGRVLTFVPSHKQLGPVGFSWWGAQAKGISQAHRVALCVGVHIAKRLEGGVRRSRARFSSSRGGCNVLLSPTDFLPNKVTFASTHGRVLDVSWS